jgi:hypothetical protein
METALRIVLAGNYMQYHQWMRENHLAPHEARFIGQESDLHGLLDSVEIIRIGTWYENPMHYNGRFLELVDRVNARIEREKARGY